MTSHLETSSEAVREGDLLHASVEPAIPTLVTARQALAVISNSSKADELVRHTINHLTAAGALMSPNNNSENREPAPRRSRAGSLVVEASTLRVGDRIEFSGANRHLRWPITGIEAKPKTRVITSDTGLGDRPVIPVRKTILVGRSPRENER